MQMFEKCMQIFSVGYSKDGNKKSMQYGGWQTELVEHISDFNQESPRVVVYELTMQQIDEELELIPCTKFSITSSDIEELKSFCITRYSSTIPFVKKDMDWWAELDIGFLSLFQEADGRYGFTLRMKTHVFTEEQFDSTIISFGTKEEERLRDRMYADVDMVREMWKTRVNKRVLDVLLPFIHGPLNEYLQGCSYSRFQELINEAFGTTIRYCDLYPSPLFGMSQDAE